jgi:hypothetical protein
VKPINVREILEVVGTFCERNTPQPSHHPEGEGAKKGPILDRARKNIGVVLRESENQGPAPEGERVP